MSNRVLIPLDLDEPPVLPPGVVEYRLSGAAMGTSWNVQALAPKGVARASIAAAVQAQLERVIREMSTWEEDSSLSRFNRAPAGSWHSLPEAFHTVLDAALTMAADSGGAFDPTIGPLVNVWGFGPQSERAVPFREVPDEAALQAARACCGWQRIALDRSARSALQPGGAYLDFSGIAKGYAVDLVAQALRAAGCVSWLAEVGGELSGFGVKADGQPWWVALERPPQDTAAQGLLVALHGLAIATSGDYRRYFERDGRRYAHTIDPRSGRPVRHDLASVTVLHPQCMVADALATALTVLGVEEGMAFARERNIAALFIGGGASGFSESMTPALAAMLD
ncbi:MULTISPECIES: FAD:protein FMN transferase [unclassified Herbaspirillum]|uniref:FAD:protein FMN transferase n=1 Tax=unclassified Herbaspirillum TaxID=2624150 RepID=UPI001150B480|nr:MULTISPECIES: FAD:protein FMN transferase [unclassified Herbaspirillum]MBB5392141.1 thiamine biosynthesis lipoprotein [Herbaspirillum sp. SJZ102]TQK13598.1 thiamine biosynthesis lipoprotein [Herbaspirillum sp. SJZ130]TQK15601.1 thiamine biosynthesis lipoprotein [Herbaspirillum sp. SJZ106]TWC71500.1 thiamine biosynthesis lipoprotein [Herbaspirillum sp. SJZ099]